ncbi:MAG: DUF1800 family protein [Acidimicrobiales bacterium]
MSTNGTTTRDEVAWLARRAAWGLRPGQLDELEALGTAAVVDLLVDPGGNGLVEEPSPWAGFDYVDEPGERARQGLAVLNSWLGHLVTTERPFENTLAWFWHDHFAVSYAVVNHLPLLLDHLDLLRNSAFGDFRTLIRDVTTDGAMLMFLDGATSTGASPNENYGRELLELYTLGIGNYTEDDVRAAAVALTGWVVAPRLGYDVRFVERRHDPTPQDFLGVSGVSGVDAVVDAAVAHPAVPGFIAGKLAAHLLGGVDSATVTALATTFADNDLRIGPLSRAVLEAGLDGRSTPQVTAPVPWLVSVLKATGAELPGNTALGLLRQMGQVPGNPPNVGGYPGASTWLASSATAGRFTAANLIARLTPADAPTLVAAADRDYDLLADLLLRPGGFSTPTLDALDGLSSTAAPRPGEAVLAVALASPDLLIR